jgi:hypothetical protein
LRLPFLPVLAVGHGIAEVAIKVAALALVIGRA